VFRSVDWKEPKKGSGMPPPSDLCLLTGHQQRDCLRREEDMRVGSGESYLGREKDSYLSPHTQSCTQSHASRSGPSSSTQRERTTGEHPANDEGQDATEASPCCCGTRMKKRKRTAPRMAGTLEWISTCHCYQSCGSVAVPDVWKSEFSQWR